MTQKNVSFETLIQESIKNIRDDRNSTESLLQDLKQYMIGGPDRHKDVGFTLAKYLETLQRSNEQLVKIAALLKKDNKEDISLSLKERESLYKELNKK